MVEKKESTPQDLRNSRLRAMAAAQGRRNTVSEEQANEFRRRLEGGESPQDIGEDMGLFPNAAIRTIQGLLSDEDFAVFSQTVLMPARAMQALRHLLRRIQTLPELHALESNLNAMISAEEERLMEELVVEGPSN
jgi:hypothetical protein